MKVGYRIAMIVLFLLMIAYAYLILSTAGEMLPHLDDALQGVAVLVALLAGVIALSSADRKRIKIKTSMTAIVERSYVEYPKSKLTPELAELFANHKDPVISRRVVFKMRNTSGFTLKKPSLTFWLPAEKKHPVSNEWIYGQKVSTDGRYNQLAFNSNLFNSRDDLRSLELGDSVVLSNSNLPYWNSSDEITIWIRMVLGDDAFSVKVSVNSENAEGVTKELQVNPSSI